MRLKDVLDALPGAVVHGDVMNDDIEFVFYDSRKVCPRSAFVAIKGHVTDGHRYIDDALHRGAIVVVSEESPREGVPWIQVASARIALALIAAALLRQPAQALSLIGVTGTNGKTTTTHLIDTVLRMTGRSSGLIGTVEYRFADRIVEASRTTPESSDLQALLREMVDAGCRFGVMEVSSHSLVLERVHGCAFDVAVFTNLTRDHLDFHGDMDSYFAAKRRLFEAYLKPRGAAIVNGDDDRSREIAAACRARVWTFGVEKPADLQAEGTELTLAGTRFRARTPLGTFDIQSPLLGRFNVENLLAALGASLALGIEPAQVAASLGELPGVPGRLERIDAGQPFAVIVDYAHTDDALRKLLETVRRLNPKRILTVFGCGGDRDTTKRPLMGAVAVRLSDIVIVTSDNPRSEPPEAIIEAIERGMNGSRTPAHLSIVDRREAIARALEMAEVGDAVVIAGKGHERYQQIRERTLPFDDREVARELLTGRSGQKERSS